MTRNDDDNDVPDLSNRELLKVLMQEIADVRRELKEDIAVLDNKITVVSSDLKGLRLQVHQNHTSFITNLQDHEKRIAVLEAA